APQLTISTMADRFPTTSSNAEFERKRWRHVARLYELKDQLLKEKDYLKMCDIGVELYKEMTLHRYSLLMTERDFELHERIEQLLSRANHQMRRNVKMHAGVPKY
ncbi:hypothetical protein PENTCL1PPCAC_5410, partial [Pristionchus entomophagus]